ncbi:Holliday junction ATP-dependent DNA helicase RuvB [Vibrio stylophorae]|uniref:DNA polymerase III subunit gamma/tau n=1 Tax=Vibrio stylophorae TaxID=659351 RepID=A0ABM8ZSM6_9VIBR|nr:DNA polymerase III subunit gamma/tau [Vibrio stylophorae]CAH0532934.1 Holliday junction ATP-dependent DNA helicase RuvB [Vibrio stylophorae]
MSYQVLARKWRPHRFEQVVGQSHVLGALSNALAQNRLHHAYLFSGTRGVGKTTIARILAKGLNCEQGVTANPCGQCATCKEIDEGRFVDLLEIDAASRTKVEDTRELLDNVQYKPARGRYKVYLIDEVHMLSRHSFNALLKTLEEPPEYVKFLLATTDPQKLPITILSRCLQFHLKHLSREQIEAQLNHVLSAEQIPFEPRALSLLARAADGSMRDALSLTDQAIALGNAQVSDQVVSTMLGTLDTDQALHLLQPVASGDAAAVMEQLDEIASVGVEWDALLKEIAAQLHRIAMLQALPNAIESGEPDFERLNLLAKALTPQEVQLFYQLILQGRQDFAFAPDGRSGVEMTLLRMLAFRPAAAEPAPFQQLASAPVATQAAAPQSVAAKPSVLSTPSAQTSPSPVMPVQAATAVPTQPVVAQPTAAQPAAKSAPGMMAAKAMLTNTAPQARPASSQAELNQLKSSQPAPQAPVDPEQAAMDAYYAEMASRDDDSEDDLVHGGSSSSAPSSASSVAQHSVEQPLVDQASVAQPAVEQHSIDQTKAPTQGSRAASIIQARNRLRSQMKAQQGESAPVKKTNATPVKKESVLERVQQKSPHGSPAPLVSHNANDAQADAAADEEYRWTPSDHYHSLIQEQAEQISPQQLKAELEHEKTPEMQHQLALEAAEQDAWSAMILQLSIPMLVQQLALNAAFEQQDQQVRLALRSSQAHLNTERAVQALTKAMREYLQQPIELRVGIDDSRGQTPLELRESIYQHKLQQAKASIYADSLVQAICSRFDANVDDASIRPL